LSFESDLESSFYSSSSFLNGGEENLEGLDDQLDRCPSVLGNEDDVDNLQVAEEEEVALRDDSSSFQMPLASGPKSKIVVIEGDGLFGSILNRFHLLDPFNFDDQYSDDSSLYYEVQTKNVSSSKLARPLRQRSKGVILDDTGDDQSMFTFHSLKNARNRGIRRLHRRPRGSVITASDKRNLDSSSASCHSQTTLSSIDLNDCNGDDNISLFSDEEDKLYETPLRS
jgi:hypothetical protein